MEENFESISANIKIEMCEEEPEYEVEMATAEIGEKPCIKTEIKEETNWSSVVQDSSTSGLDGKRQQGVKQK